MFGCCVAGRLLQTNLQQVDETHAFFEVENAASINHICVFLLGTIPLPDGYGATLHFFWPGKGFQLLGFISNDKPSAIFRLRGSFSSLPAPGAFDSVMEAGVTAMIGLSIEPLSAIEPQMATLASLSAKPDLSRDPVRFAEKLVTNLFNYISSFSGGALDPQLTIPMSVLLTWYENLLRKLKNLGIEFLERSE
ncbi:DUF775-domain-containing protein [Mycena floridula]|nr:DUF775-domain-containing protein [Mycena floridula]